MSKLVINGEEVEVIVFAADGTEDASTTLTHRELATAEAVDAALRANSEFKASYPDARLTRIESMRGVDEHREGRYYFRYRHASGVAEFWGHLAHEPKFDFKKGIVGVTLPDRR
jgi:hypothetical protein